MANNNSSDYYEDIFSGFFHSTFEVITYLINQVLGTYVLLSIVNMVKNDKVRLWVH